MDTHELLTKKKEVIAAADEIRDRVYKELNGDWRPDDSKRFDELTAEADKFQQAIDRIAKLDSLQRSVEEADRPEGRRSAPNPVETRQRQEQRSGAKITDHDRGEALRAWMTAGAPGYDVSAEQREMARRCGINIDSKRLDFSLAPSSLKPTAPDANGLRASADDIRSWQTKYTEQRAALTGAQATTTTGGYTVPDEIMQALEVALLAFGGMRQTSRIIRTGTGGPMPIPTTNDTSNKGELIGENITATELEMTFGQLVMDAFKYTSKYILASIEFLQDTSINAPEFLGSALGDRIARITNDHFTLGTGSSQPNGIVTAATASGITTAAAQNVTYDNLVDLEHSIDPAYRANSRFMLHDSALKIIKKIKVLQYSGDVSGVPLWVPGLASGAPDTILGYSYTINQSLAATGAGSKSIVFGQLSKYIIRDTKDVTLLRLDELFALLGQVAFLALSRHDGDLLDAGTHPVKYLVQGP